MFSWIKVKLIEFESHRQFYIITAFLAWGKQSGWNTFCNSRNTWNMIKCHDEILKWIPAKPEFEYVTVTFCVPLCQPRTPTFYCSPMPTRMSIIDCSCCLSFISRKPVSIRFLYIILIKYCQRQPSKGEGPITLEKCLSTYYKEAPIYFSNILFPPNHLVNIIWHCKCPRNDRILAPCNCCHHRWCVGH